jgi:SAM-dependent methyltransferase
VNDSLPHAPAAERNQKAILAVLAQHLTPGDRVLEVGSGTGQHATAFARSLPSIRWLPTDRSEVLPGLRARVEHEAVAGVEAPRILEVRTGPWPRGPFDAAFTANTCHIMSWDEVVAMFEGVGRLLRSGGRFLVYGPFFEAGAEPAESNRRFDESLRRADPRQGLRVLQSLESLAHRHHLFLSGREAMPANNLTLVFTRDD